MSSSSVPPMNYSFCERYHPQYGTCLELCVSVMGNTLRRDTLIAAHTALCFLHYRLFSVALDLPWSLCLGDMEANLRNFVAGPKPT